MLQTPHHPHLFLSDYEQVSCLQTPAGDVRCGSCIATSDEQVTFDGLNADQQAPQLTARCCKS